MKIINAHNGQLCTLPLNLGEAGRGRWLERVTITNKPGQAPDGPEAVGYFTFGDRQHCVLTRPKKGQEGILLRIDSKGTYTKGSCGSIELRTAPETATLLAEGRWATGLAGRTGDGPDQLWHVHAGVGAGALFQVFLSGGSAKGYGWRYVLVSPEGEVAYLKPPTLVEELVSGSRGWILDLCRTARFDAESVVIPALFTVTLV